MTQQNSNLLSATVVAVVAAWSSFLLSTETNFVYGFSSTSTSTPSSTATPSSFFIKSRAATKKTFELSAAIVDESLTTAAGLTTTIGLTTDSTSMNKNVVDNVEVEGRIDINEPPKLYDVRKMLPAESFQVDTMTSLKYFGLDFLAVASSMTFLHAVVTSSFYKSVPFWGQAMMACPLQILTGFAMWCMWCIGHDAGHTTVSKDKPWLNRLVGEIAHSVICLTPFVPWAKSHLKHHLNHNHLENDYSHQWFIREERDDLHPLIKLSHWTRNLQLPILYLVYLLAGVPDGGHVIFYGRMWESSTFKEKLNASYSVMVSVVTAATLWMKMGLADFTVVCFVPWCVMSFWLFMVTYLQHHSEDGRLYTDDTFSFERGAFETVDRNYGKWVNRLSHHMMDGHVVHHLFFTRVPHYRLEAATTALVEGMEERGQSHLYKSINTPDFTQEIVQQFNDNWFFINEEQIVRTNEQIVPGSTKQ
eukprot:CAMPEP_0113504596 /NCGR_PEP_ID=MMETSP0014_2-20120614/34800_1 /TAXON_ID=2857 /ORGANISM="Nitzschia sp." /LENGTH=474 /DNA_ID=CAMNT_0000399717 /DNA_START=254 /DNA_END=1678 /DNA_ORIENTATION=+ /assembly_acc=CAM_ASM_000159